MDLTALRRRIKKRMVNHHLDTRGILVAAGPLQRRRNRGPGKAEGVAFA